MNTHTTTPAPVWRLLEPGEIIQEGDEYFDVADRGFVPCYKHMQAHPASATIVHRRRLEPDPVKAELLAALEECITSEGAACFSDMNNHPERMQRRLYAISDVARAAIARAKSTA